MASFRAAESILSDGRTRAIGVCNFGEGHLERLLAKTDVVPTVNQVELHPYFAQPGLRDTDDRLDVVTQAWSPIGGVKRYSPGNPDEAEDPLRDDVIQSLADKHGKTPAQIILRWHLEHGTSVIPKSVHKERSAENFSIFDFRLTPEEVAAIDRLDTGERGGPDPDEVSTDFKISG